MLEEMSDNAIRVKAISTGTLLVIRLFGSFSIKVLEIGTSREKLVIPRTPKDFQLLAYLAYHYDTPLDREAIATLFWSTDRQHEKIGAKDALSLLTRTLTALNNGLDEPASYSVQKQQPRQILFVTEPNPAMGLRIDLDIKSWRQALVTGRAEELLEVAPLYRRGPFLEGWNDPWIVEARQQMRVDYARALERAARQAEEIGQQDLMQKCLALALEIDPWDQALWRYQMESFATQRRYTRLIDYYTELQQRSRLHGVTLEPATRDGFLKHRTKAERFIASRENGLLPAPASALISRQEEISHIVAQVAPGRLVTLLGTGGIGKSRLSIAVGRALNEEYYHRAWFIDLSYATDAAQMLYTVTTTLGIQEVPGSSLEQTLYDTLRPQRRLLILDNCEHLLDACAQLANNLLRHCPHIALLATSREALNIDGETVWEVPVLPFPPADQPLSQPQIASFGAVQLFIDRASTPQRSFELNSDTASAVAQICHYLSGIPLAIELAAARVSYARESVHRIAQMLDQSLELLTLGRRTAPTRQQTLRGAIAWSYNRLSPPEQELFRQLALFRRGFTEAAARAICILSPADVLSEPSSELLLDPSANSGSTALNGDI